MNKTGTTTPPDLSRLALWIAANPGSTAGDAMKGDPSVSYRSMHRQLASLAEANKVHRRPGFKYNRDVVLWYPGPDPVEEDDPLLTAQQARVCAWRISQQERLVLANAPRSVFDLANVRL